MSVLILMAVVLLVAFLVESLVEYVVGTPMDKIEALKPYKWLIMYVAAAVGVGAAFMWKLDLINMIADFLGGAVPVNPFGIVLTGLAIGRGANYIHDIYSKWFKKVDIVP